MNCSIRILAVIFAAACICAAGTGATNSQQATPPPAAPSQTNQARHQEEEIVRETVFRYQFEHNQSAQQQRAKVYFLMIGDDAADPPVEFMQRFANHQPPVRLNSASTNILSRGVVDKISGDQGLRFSVVSIKWISAEEAEVSGGYYEGSQSSATSSYTVKKESGKWKVTREVLRRIA